MSSIPTSKVHASLPIEMGALSTTVTVVQTQLGLPQGSLVQLETTSTGVIYTVPIGKTFTGVVRIAGSGTGTITLTAATGGVQASLGFDSKGTGAAEVNSVSIAGGGSGNALTVATTGQAAIASLAIVGHVQ